MCFEVWGGDTRNIRNCPIYSRKLIKIGFSKISMDPMRNLIFLITFCLPAVCFGQIDGKGIFCSRIDDNFGHGWFFTAGEVTGSVIVRLNDRWSIHLTDDGRYNTTSSTVRWGDGFQEWVLDRETLVASHAIIGESVNYLMVCEVYPDLTSYEARLEKEVNSRQEEYDKEREGNLL